MLGKMKLEKHLADFIQVKRLECGCACKNVKIKPTFHERSQEVLKESGDIIAKVTPYLLLGVAVGAAIHGFVPTGFFETYITKSNPFAVPIAVIVGIPMYANATSVIPIVQALIAK